jgi:site-specific DNA-methyltransferase (adenine-specific)
MKPKSKMKDKPQAEINTVLYAVAPQPKLSTDAIALDGAVVSRGNGIGATSETYLMDCIVGMKHYPDKYFDLAIVDPPYGINEANSNRSKNGLRNPLHSKTGKRSTAVKVSNYSKKDWDKVKPKVEYFNELFRVSKNQIVWGVNHFNHFSFPSSGRIFWDKCTGENDFSDGELAFCSLHSRIVKFTFMWNGMMQGKSATEGHIQEGNKSLCEKRIHPTQKPVTLYNWLLKTYAKEGDKILDTHLGSGSSRIAANIRGFHFTGFELDEEHFFDQEERFKNYQAQLNIFNK